VKATAIEVEDTRATVMLTPCWIARLLGARPVMIELKRDHPLSFWFTVTSHRRLGWIPYSRQIEHALDFRAVTDLPLARSVSR